MSLVVVTPGLQTTIQAGPRIGFRDRGVPAAGPADGVSAALVNRAAGNVWDAPLLEITLGGFEARIEGPATLAVGGAEAEISMNGVAVDPWTPVAFGRGVRDIRIGPASKGARVYLAIRGGFGAEEFLGSKSTYLPAGLGGHQGRALKEGDALEIAEGNGLDPAAVPGVLRPFMADGWALPATASGETDWLAPKAREQLFGMPFSASRQSSRMGVGLEGTTLDVPKRQLAASVPVFPGTVQCPESGHPFILSADAQTTGGYPRVAQVIRADRHRIGQICPGDRVTFVETSPQEAADILRTKKAALAAFIGSRFQL